jgi:hypothetical protein
MWNNDPKTDSRWVDVPSLANTRKSRSTGCGLHECPACGNLWSLSVVRSTVEVLFRTVPVREGGVVVDHIVTGARTVNHCWCGVPLPGDALQSVTDNQARANAKSSLRLALSAIGEEPSIVEEIELLATKVSRSMLDRLRGERSRTKAAGVA